MSDTPRTDAMVKTFEGYSDLAIIVACVNEMQRFERELTAAQAAHDVTRRLWERDKTELVAAQAAIKRRDEVIEALILNGLPGLAECDCHECQEERRDWIAAKLKEVPNDRA
jgi:hypothetical protein